VEAVHTPVPSDERRELGMRTLMNVFDTETSCSKLVAAAANANGTTLVSRARTFSRLSRPPDVFLGKRFAVYNCTLKGNVDDNMLRIKHPPTQTDGLQHWLIKLWIYEHLCARVELYSVAMLLKIATARFKVWGLHQSMAEGL